MKTIEEMVTDLAPFQQRRMARCALAGATFTFKPGGGRRATALNKGPTYQSSKWTAEKWVAVCNAAGLPTSTRITEPTLGRCVERMWKWMLDAEMIYE